MLKSFVRDTSYFQIVRNSNQLLTGSILDGQFSNLINYINNKILPFLNNLSNSQIGGVLDSPGYLLRNIGDGTVQFSRLRNSDLKKEVIKLDRFKPITPNSILYGSNLGLSYLTSSVTYNTLTYENNILDFRPINATVVEDRSITSDRIGINTLTTAHLVPGLNITPNFITNEMIADQALINYNLFDQSITYFKFSPLLVATRNNNGLQFIRQNITNLPSDSHIIKLKHIPKNAIPYNQLFFNAVNHYYVLSPANVPNNIVIDPRSFSPYVFFNAGIFPMISDYITNSSFVPKNVNANTGINKSKLSIPLLNYLKSKGGL